MATFFGELQEPVTRAISADHFEEEYCCDSVQLSIELDDSIISENESYDVIYFMCGKLAYGFAETHLIDDIERYAGKIEIINEKSKEKKNCKPCLFFLDDKKIICCVPEQVSSGNEHKFVSLISSLLRKCKRIVLLTSDNVSSFKSEELNGGHRSTFLYSLHTSNYTDTVHSEWLPVPNFVTGITAAVISHCQIQNLPAVVYVCFTDEDVLDSITAEPFIKLCKKLQIKIKNNVDFRKIKILYDRSQLSDKKTKLYI